MDPQKSETKGVIDLETGDFIPRPENADPKRYVPPDVRINISNGPQSGTILAHELKIAREKGFAAEGAGQTQERIHEEKYGNKPLVAAGLGAARAGTLGLSDVLYRGIGVPAETLRGYAEENPGATVLGEVAGAVINPIGRVGKAVKAVAGGGIIGGLAGGVVEGAAFGAGAGTSELALSDEPITAERVVSVLGSNALYGAAIGGPIGAGAGMLERAANGLQKRVAAGVAPVARTGDELAGEIIALRNEVKALPWEKLAKTPGWAPETGAVGKKAARALGNLVDAPDFLAAKPHLARKALEIQGQGLKRLIEEAPELRKAITPGGTRAAALDALPGLLQRNEALRASLGAFEDSLSSQGKKGIVAQALQGGAYGAAFGGVMGLASPVLGPWVGAAVAGAVAGKVGKVVGEISEGTLGRRLAAGAAAQSERIQRAIGSFVEVGGRVARKLPMTTQTLKSVSYAPATAPPTQQPYPTKNERVKLFRARAAEIRTQTTVDISGKHAVLPEVRSAIAARLRAIGAISPVLADRAETLAVARLEFLAEKLPKRTDASGIPFGPDRWQPSELDLAAFARTALAIEDPAGVVERLADGTVTPEEAEVLRNVYPEIFNQVRDQIFEKLPELRVTLPYARRLSLSILMDVPVDPAMDPRVLDILQGHFDAEPGTEGGTQQPLPTPQFGSVSKPEPTGAQLRSG